jgi:PIN domain nuclease of toxin-antitoxin system
LGRFEVIVIDTHVWLWWVNNDPKLKAPVRTLIDAESDIRVSAISLFELSMAVAAKRVVLNPSPREWFAAAQSAPQIRIEPLTDEICLESVSLPGEIHRDPADRLIVALARMLNAALVTADGKLLKFDGVQTIAAT